MAVSWTESEQIRVDDGVRRYPIESGRCAALARVVHAVGRERDAGTRARQVRPRSGRYVVPKTDQPPQWGSHTFVDAHDHSIDALTGAAGSPVADYLDTHWLYPAHLSVEDVDVDQIDAGIQDEA